MKISSIKWGLVCITLSLIMVACGVGGGSSLIPKDASFVMGIDVTGTLKSEVAKSIMKTAASLAGGDATANPEDTFDKTLQEQVGVALKDIDKVTAFTTAMSADFKKAELGVIIGLKSDAAKILEGVKTKFNLTEETYNGVKYLKGSSADDGMFVFASGTNIGISNLEPILKKMIDVSKGADDISKNPALSSIVNEYKGHSIYTVGVIPKEMMAEVPEPVNKLTDIALGLTLAADIKIKASSESGSADNAKLVSDYVNGLKTVATAGLAQAGAEIQKLGKDIIDPLSLVPQGSKVTLNVTYSKAVIDSAIAIIPSLMMMGLGGNPGADTTVPTDQQ
jgi:hypothetical protein